MNDVRALARPEIRSLRPYRAATYESGLLRLNANETPWRPAGDQTERGLNWYPETRPVRLTNALAAHYGVTPEQLLVTRGSSEAIDLLVRCFCRPGTDRVMLCPPTFGMYEVYAQLQGALVDHVPLDKNNGYTLDLAALEAALTDDTRLLFLCSPNNPTGNALPLDQIEAACRLMDGRGLVVVDAAYVEFADQDPTRDLLDQFAHVVVLRTLSKALGLAGVRCGAALAAPSIIDLLACILPPYSYSTPCADAVLAALADPDTVEQHIATLRAERQRVADALRALPDIQTIWPSAANFILVESTSASQYVAAAKSGGVSIRDFSWDPYTPGCVRITIGDPAQNDQLLEALANV